jgi:hypothetical protein
LQYHPSVNSLTLGNFMLPSARRFPNALLAVVRRSPATLNRYLDPLIIIGKPGWGYTAR